MSRPAGPAALAALVVFASLSAGLVGAADPAPAGDEIPANLVVRAGHGGVTGPLARLAVPGAGLGVPALDEAAVRPSGPVDSAGPVDSTADGAGADRVRVGVIGSAFDRDSGPLAGRVAAHHRVDGVGLRLVGGTGHDTAVAGVVAERAEAAALYLVAVGRRPTPGEYARAVEWLLANDVDVIVDAGSYYPQTAEGRARIAAVTERAAERGTVFVTSGGNTGRRHWRAGGEADPSTVTGGEGAVNGTETASGTRADADAGGTAPEEATESRVGVPDEPGWVAFAPGVEGNRLLDPADGEATVGGVLTLRLYWEGDADYDLYLYRDRPGGEDPVVAKSTRESGRAEAIDVRVPAGSYYVGVYAREPGDGSVDLYAARHRLAYAGANGSTVAPATTAGVISVGALGADGAPAAYSATGTDVLAPGSVQLTGGGELVGTSAAAPAVAGTVAEMHAAADGELSPRRIERLLRDTASGGGIDPEAAVAAAANATDEEPV